MNQLYFLTTAYFHRLTGDFVDVRKSLFDLGKSCLNLALAFALAGSFALVGSTALVGLIALVSSVTLVDSSVMKVKTAVGLQEMGQR